MSHTESEATDVYCDTYWGLSFLFSGLLYYCITRIHNFTFISTKTLLISVFLVFQWYWNMLHLWEANSWIFLYPNGNQWQKKIFAQPSLNWNNNHIMVNQIKLDDNIFIVLLCMNVSIFVFLLENQGNFGVSKIYLFFFLRNTWFHSHSMF